MITRLRLLMVKIDKIPEGPQTCGQALKDLAAHGMLTRTSQGKAEAPRMSAPDRLGLNQCLLCQGTPAALNFSLPPQDRVVKEANGQTIPYTLCAPCAARPDACEAIDAALRAKDT
jgi:hypothetical protein